MTLVPGTAPTCTEGGTADYYICEQCDDWYYNKYYAMTYFEDLAELELEPLGHKYMESTYEWAEDYSSVTARRVCSRNFDHVETETVATTATVTKAPGPFTMGEHTYTAEFENPAFATQTFVLDDIEPLGIPLTEQFFPDDNFRSYVTEKYDKDDNHHLSDTERSKMETFICNGLDIASFEGIEYFPNLFRLYANNNPNLTELSIHGFPKLYHLQANNCALTQVHVTGCPALSALILHGNPLTELDLSSCSSLIQLDLINCTTLRTLNISNYPNLIYLNIYGSGINYLNIQSNPYMLEALNGTKTVETDYDHYAGDGCYMKVNHGTEFSGQGCIPIDEAHFPDETFRDLIVDNFDTNSTGWLSPAEIAAVTDICFEDHDYTTVQGIEYFAELQAICITGADSLMSIDLRANTKLTDIDLGRNGLTEINLDGLTRVVILCVNDNNLTTLDVSGLTALRSILCDNNGLTALDLSHNTGLTDVECYNNPLASLNLGSQSSLAVLHCYGTDLTDLDITGCPRLIEAYHGTKNTSSPDYDMYSAPDCSLYVNKGMRIDAGDPEPTFFLPSSLTSIEAEAFSGIAAEAVFIPASVTSISGDPFAGSAVTHIYGLPGTAAETFVSSHAAYTFIPVTAEWVERR